MNAKTDIEVPEHTVRGALFWCAAILLTGALVGAIWCMRDPVVYGVPTLLAAIAGIELFHRWERMR